MRAIVFDGTRTNLVDDVTVRDPGPGEVLVRIHASGLCQSDLSVISGVIPFPVPVVLGHEGAGVIEAVGQGVATPRVGEHVVLSTLASCGACKYCASGRPTLCPDTWGSGATPFSRQGDALHNFAAASTFTELTVVRASQAIVIPSDIPLSTASVLGCCVLTGVGAALHRVDIHPGDSVAVVGCGGVGLNAIQGARIAGAGCIIAIDVNPAKTAIAEAFGATHFIEAGQDDVNAQVRELTRGGVTHVFDCVGQPTTVRSSVDMTAAGGTVVVLGVPPRGTELTVPASALYLNRAVIGCRYGDSQPAADIPLFVELYRSGRLKLDELVSRIYPFEEFDDLLSAARNGQLDRGVLTF